MGDSSQGEGVTGGPMTERQRKWFATVRANFAEKTGKPIEAWIAIARAGCADLPPKAQAAWLREQHGLGANHAAGVISRAFPKGPGWDDPASLRAALWKDPASLAIFEAVERAATAIPDLLPTQRKGYSAFSRSVQFAAIRPLRGGRALLGLKLDPSSSPRLTAAVRKESWSERLSSIIELESAAEVDAEIGRLLAAAGENG